MSTQLTLYLFMSTQLKHVFRHHVTHSNLRRHNHRHRLFRHLGTCEALLEIAKKKL